MGCFPDVEISFVTEDGLKGACVFDSLVIIPCDLGERRRKERGWRRTGEFSVRQHRHTGLCFHTCKLCDEKGD